MIAQRKPPSSRRWVPRKPNRHRYASLSFELPPRKREEKSVQEKWAAALAATAVAAIIAGFSLWSVAGQKAEVKDEFIVEAEVPAPPAPDPPPDPPPPPPPPRPPPRAVTPPEPPPEKQFGLEKEDLAETSDLAVATGNTLETKADTIVRLMPTPAPEAAPAAKEETGPRLGSVARVSRMPKVKSPVKPEYTLEMRKNGITGKVKARVLVDADGKAAKIEILEDLGYGTREAAIAALGRMEFEPAVMDGEPVALWIPFTYTFELQE